MYGDNTELPEAVPDTIAPRPGELWFATVVPPEDVPGPTSTRLVLVVEVDADAGFVLAMLTTNETEMASDRDVVLPGDQLGLPYSLSIACDLVGAVWISQLESRIGALGGETFSALLELRQGAHVPSLLPYQGLPLDDPQDARWQFKVTELAVMQALSASCTASLADPKESDIVPVLQERGSAVALGTILSGEMKDGPLSLQDLAVSTGLPQTTVSKAVNALLEQGFVIRDHESVRINEDRPCAVGVSVRPDELVGVVTNLRAIDLVPPRRRSLPSTDVAVVVEAVRELLDDLLSELPNEQLPMGLGVELSGHIDGRFGEVVYSPDLLTSGDSWRSVYLADLLREATGLDTVVENDANALALHEQWFGDGIGLDSFATVLIGSSGIGCGLVIDGTLAHGAEGIAGEIGHVVLDPDGPDCRCGNKGCLETFASPQAICDFIGGEGGVPAASLENAAQRLRQNEPRAVEAFLRAGEYLGRGLSMVLNLVNPSHVVIFGPPQLTDPASAGPPATLFRDALEQAVERYSFSFAAWRYDLLTKVADGRLGPKGAASAVLSRMMARPISSPLLPDDRIRL